MPTFRLDGTWFEHLYEALPPVIEAMRHGAGPALVEAMVVRLDPHSSSDDHRKYRGETELQTITGRDPILQTERYLLRNAVVTDEEVASLRAELKAEVDRAADSNPPHPRPDESTVMGHIYSNDPALLGEPQPPCYLSGQEVTMIDAINHGLREEMERNPKIVMWGEDVADTKGGVFGVTRGLSSAFPGRVFN